MKILLIKGAEIIDGDRRVGVENVHIGMDWIWIAAKQRMREITENPFIGIWQIIKILLEMLLAENYSKR